VSAHYFFCSRHEGAAWACWPSCGWGGKDGRERGSERRGREDGHIICDWLASAGKGRSINTHKHMHVPSKVEVGEKWRFCSLFAGVCLSGFYQSGLQMWLGFMFKRVLHALYR
jgi:hypothetical protein